MGRVHRSCGMEAVINQSARPAQYERLPPPA